MLGRIDRHLCWMTSSGTREERDLTERKAVAVQANSHPQ